MGRVTKAVSVVVLCALIIDAPSTWANWLPNGLALCTATGVQYSPMIASDGAGGAIATWVDYRNGSRDIYTQRVDASGTPQWIADGVPLSTATADQQYPAIISDGAGGAIVTWVDYRNGNNDIYAERVNASGAVLWTTDGVPLCTTPQDQQYPAITSDGSGGAIVTWMDNRSGNYDVYAQRVDASGTAQWTADGVPISTAAGDQSYPTLISDSASGAIVTWQDSRSGSGDIYAQRVDASGVVQWVPNGIAVCTATWYQQYPTIISDGAAGAIVTWQDGRSQTGYAIYAQRVNRSGAVEWMADGVALCTPAGVQLGPTLVSDGASGAIVTWMDDAAGDIFDPKFDIYAQRVNASGAVQWTTDAVPLSTATGNQMYPTITSDGTGGAIVTWQDDRSEAYDYHIYAQRVNASGAVQWATNGVAICTAMGNQFSPMITRDGAGGAIVTWYDYRAGNKADIYGLRVDANGLAVLTATELPAVRIELHQNYPNPFNPATTVTYSVPEKCNVTLKIYDVSGACIACLVDAQRGKGSYSVEWNGKDEEGNSVESGVYLYRLSAGTQAISKKMVLLR